MSNKKNGLTALAGVLDEPLGTVFNTLTERDVSIALAAVFAVVVDARANCATAHEVFSVLNRKTKLRQTTAEVKELLERLVEEGLIAALGAKGNHFFLLTEIGYFRAVRLFPKMFEPFSPSKKK